MKKTLSVIIGSAMIVAVAASLTACGEKPAPAPAPETTVAETAAPETAAPETVAETQPEYMGYQYSAKDPWGGEVSITLREEKDGKLNWTYTDVIDQNTMVYKEVTSDYTNGYSEWTIEGDVDTNGNGNATFKYSGNLKLQGDGVELTYTDGAITTHSENGDSDAYQVGPLKDSGTNTVFLEKAKNN